MNRLKTTKEIKEIKRYRNIIYIVGALFICIFGGLGHFFVNCRTIFGFHLPCPSIESNYMREILIIFPAILATVTAIIFALPWPGAMDKFPINKRKVILSYLLWMVPNILFPVFVYTNIVKFSQLTFNVSMFLFIFSLTILIPYVMIFSQANRAFKISLWFGIAARSNLVVTKKIKEKKFTKAREASDSMRDLVLQAVQDNDQKCFVSGIKKSHLLLIIVIRSHNLSQKRELIKRIDLVVKEFLQNFCIIAAECIKIKNSPNTQLIVNTMEDIIRETMELEGEENSFDYPIYITELRKVALMCLQNKLPIGAGGVVDMLGALEEKTLSMRESQKKSFEIPPDLFILAGLEQIGIESSRERYETLTIDILIRLRSIADLTIENNECGQNKKVFEEALKSYWVVSAYMLKFIPEAEEWLWDNEDVMREMFGEAFDRAYGLAEKELGESSFIGLRVLGEYRARPAAAEVSGS